MRGHFHVGLALLRHLPLLVHHLLEVVQEGSRQAACVPGLLPPSQLLGIAVPNWGRRNILGDGGFNCFNHLDIVIKGYLATRGFGQRVGFLESWGFISGLGDGTVGGSLFNSSGQAWAVPEVM